MRVQRLPYKNWTAFCPRCRRGSIQGDCHRLLGWAIQHGERCKGLGEHITIVVEREMSSG